MNMTALCDRMVSRCRGNPSQRRVLMRDQVQRMVEGADGDNHTDRLLARERDAVL